MTAVSKCAAPRYQGDADPFGDPARPAIRRHLSYRCHWCDEAVDSVETVRTCIECDAMLCELCCYFHFLPGGPICSSMNSMVLKEIRR